jgi:hypothetical protein
LLRTGFAEPRRSPAALVSSYLTLSPLPGPGPGGLLSVALSAGRPAWDTLQRPALWSPDFPRPEGRGRPAGSYDTIMRATPEAR